ncbi:MAG: phosphonate ABC transporter, permease protein PhnE [Chloroflexi bacterium]|nr:MAG: phosphonate ABC transporter, permease protein PhnE [Chloroflexota bacterium]
MSSSTETAPNGHPQRVHNPWLAAGLSVIIPGLGQFLLGLWGRAAALFFSVGVSIAIIIWQQLTGLYFFVAFIWLWNIWDAFNLARNVKRSYFPALLATLIIIYSAGWVITEIEPAKLFAQAHRAAPIVNGMLNPDFLERESESRKDRGPFEVPCSDNPPDALTTLDGGATITLSKPCGEVGDQLHVEGNGFWPNTPTELWWANPIGQEQRLTQDGQQIVLTSDDSGAFAADITVPQAVPLSHQTEESQSHAVQINQTRIIGGWGLSTNGALVLEKMAETLAIALMATSFAIIFAVPLSFVAARNLMSGHPWTLAIYYVVRTILNIVRSIESLIIAIVFVVWVGLGPFAGVMALTVHSIAALGKLYSEQVENIDFGPIEAVRAAGANWYQIVVYAVLPQVVAPFLAFTIYRWDINVRMSTILGFVGGGGIGFLIVQWQRLSEWEAIGAAFWSIMVIVALLDYVSAKAREKLV